MLCAPLDWQYAELPSSASDAVLCSVLVRKQIGKKKKKKKKRKKKRKKKKKKELVHNNACLLYPVLVTTGVIYMSYKHLLKQLVTKYKIKDILDFTENFQW